MQTGWGAPSMGLRCSNRAVDSATRTTRVEIQRRCLHRYLVLYARRCKQRSNLGYAAMTEDAMSGSGQDGVPAETLRSIPTPDRVDSRLSTLEFRDEERLRCRNGTS